MIKLEVNHLQLREMDGPSLVDRQYLWVFPIYILVIYLYESSGLVNLDCVKAKLAIFFQSCHLTHVANPCDFGTDPDADLYLWLMNPDANLDPAIYVSSLHVIFQR